MFVFFLGLAVTACAMYLVIAAEQKNDQRRFERLVARVQSTLESRIDDHERVLTGLRGLFAASPQLTRGQFRLYVDQMNLDNYPGALGYGFIHYLSDARLPAFLAQMRADQAPDFSYKRLSSGPEHFVITYVEPDARNHAVLGLDLCWESSRRQAVQAAVEQDTAVLTPRITLIQDEKHLAGFLLLLPVYKQGSGILATPEARWKNLAGLVYAPLRIDELLGGVAEQTDRMVDFELYEGPQIARSQLLFDADGHLGNSTQEITSADYARRKFSQSVQLDIAGQVWTLLVTGNREFDRSVQHQTALFILVAGLLSSLLLSALLATTNRTAIQARRQAQQMTQELRLSEQEAREMLHEIEQQKMAMDEHAIVAATDPQGTINYVNAKFCSLSGYSEAELIGQNHRLLNSGHHDRAFFRDMYRTIARGKVWHGEICNRAKDGHVYWVSTTIVPFLSRAGKPLKYVAMRTDITHIKEAEALLARQKEELQVMVDEQTADLIVARDRAESASRAKSEFITNMSHELRTPMHGILALSEMGLKREGQLPPEKQLQYFTGIANSGKRLMRLVDDVLSLSVLDSDKTLLTQEKLDLVPLLAASVAASEAAALRKNQTLRWEPPATPRLAKADSGQLTQLMGNLLDNAIKFSPPESTIHIQCESTVLALAKGQAPVPALRVSIADEGPGIPEDELESVFETFSQSSRTNTGAGGTGLGLSICRQIVRAHGGRIYARENPGGGTLIEFTLPLLV